VEIDSREGGVCSGCNRNIPGAITRFPLSMTMTIAEIEGGVRERDPVLDPADELVGRRLGHFEILEVIGRGGMGQVYRALDTSLQRYVAVKVIRVRSGHKLDTAGRQRLMHEAVAQARVNHPNIVTIYFVGMEEDTPFLAMELIDGYDVADLIAQGEIPYETLCRFAIKVTHALDTASQMGIIHSDIKPQNLLVLANGEVKLSDFGMAQILDDGESQAVGGTPNYLAPELLAGGSPTIQSDMYALGVTLYEMTFGRLPVMLSGSTPREWARVHEVSRVDFPSHWPEHLPERWRTVLLKLLARNPADRFASYQELGSELYAILPTQRADAKRLPRLIAWCMDVLIICLMALPFFLLVQLIRSFVKIGLLSFIQPFSILLALVAYTMIVVGWRQSLGRELFHIKIVNQYGLEPAARTMATRFALRMMPLWLLALVVVVDNWFPLSDAVFVGLAVIWLLVDGGLVMLSRGASLHDRILKTRAVVGSSRD
jgi:tRNA A-37 threonylcarbamoyl transferase component Bud32